MAWSFDYNGYTEQFEKAAWSLLRTARASSDIAGKMHLLTVSAERDLARCLADAELQPVACGPGCGACCMLNVAVLIPEAIAITWYLRRRYDVEQRIDLQERLTELHRRTAWLDDEERMFLREPCAFLDRDGCCMIHLVRPLLCRSITSSDADACRNGLAMVALDGLPSIDMNMLQKGLMDAAFCGIAKALGELGLDNRSWRLTSAVLWLFSEPRAINSFLAGEQQRLH